MFYHRDPNICPDLSLENETSASIRAVYITNTALQGEKLVAFYRKIKWQAIAVLVLIQFGVVNFL